MNKEEFENYKDNHYNEYQLKKMLLIISSSLFVVSLFLIYYFLSYSIAINTASIENFNYTNLSGIFAIMLFVLIPLMLINGKTFRHPKQVLGFRSFVSWSTILWSFTQSVILFIIGTTGMQGSIIHTPSNKYVLYILLVSFILLHIFGAIFKDKFTILSPDRLLPTLFFTSKENRSYMNSFIFLACLYLFLIFLFGFWYYALGSRGLSFSDKFSALPGIWDYIYFSCITITSTGYGDIAPLGYGKLLASIQSVLGNLYIPLSIGVMFTRGSRRAI